MTVEAVSPRSLGEAITHLAGHADVRLLAGCTDILVAGAGSGPERGPVMDLLRIPELRGIAAHGGTLSIGATTTFAELGRNEIVRRCFPAVSEMSGVVGGWQIQTRATVGGNIANASPAGDSLPVWLALDAVVVVAGPAGQRRIPYRGMHLGYRRTALQPGELIERIEVPLPRIGTRLWFRKVGLRRALAISTVVAAGAFSLADDAIVDARVAVGCMAPVPMRLTAVEQLVSGRRPSAALADEAGRLASASVQPLDDVRASAAYRAWALGRIIRRCVLDAGRRDGD